MAEEEKKKEEEKKDDGEKQPMMSKTGAIVVVVFLLIYTAGLMMVLGGGEPKEAESEEAAIEKTMTPVSGETTKIAAINVNIVINSNGETKLMNVEVTIESDTADTAAQVALLEPWIQDKLLNIINGMSYINLSKPGARQNVKTRLKGVIQKRFKEHHQMGVIKEVLITNFMFAG